MTRTDSSRCFKWPDSQNLATRTLQLWYYLINSTLGQCWESVLISEIDSRNKYDSILELEPVS